MATTHTYKVNWFEIGIIVATAAATSYAVAKKFVG